MEELNKRADTKALAQVSEKALAEVLLCELLQYDKKGRLIDIPYEQFAFVAEAVIDLGYRKAE